MFLDRIVTQTRLDLEERKQTIPLAEIQLQAVLREPPRDLLAALRPTLEGDRHIRLIAEVKRASPSKGLLAPHLDPVEVARTYEAHGASAISVLTEPHFFLGSPAYLTAIKQAVQVPVLRKDFIIDEYQVYEARAWGADAILLICAILDDNQLRHLLKVAHDQRMRCLVEVHNASEARRAVAAGAVIIGVNSRDLVTFEMHPYLLRELRPLIPTDRIVVAESGIYNANDTRRLARADVQAMLVGESLVKSSDIPAQIQMLLHGANAGTQVKICGLREPEHIDAAIDAGADMLGLIFYEPSHRYIAPEQVQATLAQTRYAAPKDGQSLPDLVGVFVNKDARFINDVIAQAGLHFVQLHGNEPPEFSQQIHHPVLKALQLRSAEDKVLVNAHRKTAWRILLDTPTTTWGGTGETHDWELARTIAQTTPIILAGGLTPENVQTAITQVQPWGVDVSSGVETHKQKDITKIRTFLEQVRRTTKET
ncbi:MAG TPA: bifunctional indole-3-glycerol-phosphate synthase TrpC/phosphoribosylanthranilate isomerase TrpF [Ktedonobacteraceae bacterium]|nr:bifunctional indole-3-glycerol-phosphate synthase TrpC/phosphoribosylanthranilate isomerase TrpF [Ktedonobacteraceae bacterium]